LPSGCELISFVRETDLLETLAFDLVVIDRGKDFLSSDVPDAQALVLVAGRQQEAIRVELDGFDLLL